MAQQSSKQPDGVGHVESAALDSLLSEFMGMASVFRTSRQRNRLLIMAAALIAVVGATAYAQVKLNAWNLPFYNALTRKDLPAFVEQIGVFAVLAGTLLVLNVAQTGSIRGPRSSCAKAW
jgi:vitamin B12/bleomycin/antimicrobial peptide transport system ATP-binding/permease protein